MIFNRGHAYVYTQTKTTITKNKKTKNKTREHIALMILFMQCGNLYYYKDRSELWGFINEINSGISHVKYQFFPPVLLLHNYKCGGYVSCRATVNTHTTVS
jgi:hypothetical protein